MRKIKTFDLDGKEVTVKELRVKDIRQILASAASFDGDLSQAAGLLPLATNLTVSEVDDLAPSELKRIWAEFREVNADFFDLMAKNGITGVLKKSVLSSLTESFAALSNTDTAGALSTVTGFSEQPPMSPAD